MRQEDRKARGGEVPRNQEAPANQGRWATDVAGVSPDPRGRSALQEEPRRGSLPGLGAKAPGIGGAAATATDHEGWRQAPAAPSGGQRPLRAWALRRGQ